MKLLKSEPERDPSLSGPERALSRPEGLSIKLKVRYALALLSPLSA